MFFYLEERGLKGEEATGKGGGKQDMEGKKLHIKYVLE